MTASVVELDLRDIVKFYFRVDLFWNLDYIMFSNSIPNLNQNHYTDSNLNLNQAQPQSFPQHQLQPQVGIATTMSTAKPLNSSSRFTLSTYWNTTPKVQSISQLIKLTQKDLEGSPLGQRCEYDTLEMNFTCACRYFPSLKLLLPLCFFTFS